MTRVPRLTACCAALASSILPIAAGAATPGDVADLVGSRTYEGQKALESRGYSRTGISPGDDRSWSYWWNSSHRSCLSVVTMDGKLDSIVEAPSVDCKQPADEPAAAPASAGSASASRDNSGAAAAAIGAAVLIGAAALAHNSHHHDDGKHYDDRNSESEYERGFRDGLYFTGYHNYSNNKAYSRGYEDGSRQRGYETAHRAGHYQGAGYSPYGNLDDLVHQDNDYARREMQRRGFRQLESYRNESDRRVETWWNGGSQQCVAMTMGGGKVREVYSMPKRSCR